jgi:hypothetical protein
MITEIAQIDVKPGMEAEFEAGMKNAAPIFKRAKGCHAMELQRSIEQPSRYRLFVTWECYLGDGREPQYRLSRLARFSGMAQARRPLLCVPALWARPVTRVAVRPTEPPTWPAAREAPLRR